VIFIAYYYIYLLSKDYYASTTTFYSSISILSMTEDLDKELYKVIGIYTGSRILDDRNL